MHIITGIGRSGTSFISAIMTHLGHDMGRWIAKVNAGFEDPDIASLNNRILGSFYRAKPEEKEQLRTLSKKSFVVKDPRFSFTIGHWIQAGAKIDSVVYCARSPEEIIKSSEKSMAGMMAVFNGTNMRGRKKIIKAVGKNFAATLRQNNIEMRTIAYPNSTRDYSEVRCLFKLGIAPNESALKVAWYRAKQNCPTGTKV